MSVDMLEVYSDNIKLRIDSLIRYKIYISIIMILKDHKIEEICYVTKFNEDMIYKIRGIYDSLDDYEKDNIKERGYFSKDELDKIRSEINDFIDENKIVS